MSFQAVITPSRSAACAWRRAADVRHATRLRVKYETTGSRWLETRYVTAAVETRPASNTTTRRRRRKLAWYQTTVVAIGIKSESTSKVSTTSEIATAGKNRRMPSSGK